MRENFLSRRKEMFEELFLSLSLSLHLMMYAGSGTFAGVECLSSLECNSSHLAEWRVPQSNNNHHLFGVGRFEIIIFGKTIENVCCILRL